MRVFHMLLKRAREPQNIKAVPFKAVLPMALRNRVSGKSDRQPMVPCLQELTVLFAKLKEQEYNDQLCEKEVEKLREANRQHMTNRYLTKQIRNEGVVTPGKVLHYKQLNKYLKLFPNPE